MRAVSGDAHDLVSPEPRDEPAGQPRAEGAADTTVLRTRGRTAMARTRERRAGSKIHVLSAGAGMPLSVAVSAATLTCYKKLRKAAR
jgi:hypothetical protein